MLQSPVPLPISFAPALDARAAVFTTAVSLICGIGVGLAPWLQIRVADLSARLKESSRGSDGPRSQRLRSGLVVAEVALAVVLLVGASLMIQSIRRVAVVDPGIRSRVAADRAHQRAECGDTATSRCARASRRHRPRAARSHRRGARCRGRGARQRRAARWQRRRQFLYGRRPGHIHGPESAACLRASRVVRVLHDAGYSIRARSLVSRRRDLGQRLPRSSSASVWLHGSGPERIRSGSG